MNRLTVGGNGGEGVRGSFGLVALLGVALFTSVPGAAKAAETRDIFGIWLGIGDGRPDIDPRFRNTANSPTPEFTKWGAEESGRLGRLGTETGTPGACEPVNPAMLLSGSNLFPVQILEGSKQIVILNEWQPVPRRIYMDGRGHPPDLDPTWQGHSIGHWEGDVLVVDTVGLNGRARPLNGYAANAVNATPESLKTPRLPASDQMHLVERLRLVANGNLLEITRTITDPKTYIRPFTSTVYQERRPDLDVQEYFCSDNARPAEEGHEQDEGRQAK